MAITAGQTYVISVNRNDFYPFTPHGLASQIVAGPVSTVVGGNGVFADAAGTFPTGSFADSDYLVDLMVADPAVAPPPPAPTVTATTPADAATAVPVGVSPTATFSRAMNPASITGASVTLRPQGGSPVAATVTYNAATRRVTIDPAADLATDTNYTAQVSTAPRRRPARPSARRSAGASPRGPPPTVTAPPGGHRHRDRRRCLADGHLLRPYRTLTTHRDVRPQAITVAASVSSTPPPA